MAITAALTLPSDMQSSTIGSSAEVKLADDARQRHDAELFCLNGLVTLGDYF